jgi:hypothetical protein
VETVKRDWKLTRVCLLEEMRGRKIMHAEPWQNIEQLYHAALERDVCERPAFLQQVCAGMRSYAATLRHCWIVTSKRRTF